MIGFIPSKIARTAVNNDQGQRIAWIASQNGRQVIQDNNGNTVARIIGSNQ